MIMKLKIMEQDGVVGMVEFQQMLKCPRFFIVLCLHIMDIYGVKIDGPV